MKKTVDGGICRWLLVLIVSIAMGCGGGSGGDATDGANGNRAPTALAGDDRTVAVGSRVTLDGSNSSDAEGDALTYAWRFVTRPLDSTASLTDSAAVGPYFSADTAGEYIIELTVSDDTAASSDAVIITAATGQTTSDCTEVVPGANIADDFVCAHNDVRADAQPTPSPLLPEMTWDPQLAQIAQNYGETCTWEHNSNRSDEYPGYVGENLYITTAQNSTPENAVDAWASEDRYYDYSTNTCQNGEVCGHYTQLVWRSSVKVGCARVFCPTVNRLNYTNAYLYVCNYAPGGNYNGQKPY